MKHSLTYRSSAALAVLAAITLAGCPGPTPGNDAADAADVPAPDTMDAMSMGDTHTGGDALDTLDTPNTIDALDAADAFQLPPRSPCTTHLQPTGVSPDAGAGDDDITVQTALILANAGDVICFDDGNYYFSQTLTLNTRNITLQGTASNAVLDFTAQTIGSDSIHITGDGFTIQYLTIQNYQGNGIKADGPTGVTFRAIHALWNTPPSETHGLYAIYPVDCTNVLIEGCEVSGGADSGIYVGQSSDIIVRDNLVHDNVGGIEIENCSNSAVYANSSYNNAAGILVFVDPGLQTMGLGFGHVYDNQVYSNNTNSMGFCHPGDIVCNVPVGIGIMVMAAKHTELNGNEIHDNESVGLLIVDYRTEIALTMSGGVPAGYDPTVKDVCVHDNTFMHNGYAPSVSAIPALSLDVIWDGDYDAPAGMACTDNMNVQLCLPHANNPAIHFLCADLPDSNRANLALTPTANNCTCTGVACSDQ